jgi:hypothetical protein
VTHWHDGQFAHGVHAAPSLPSSRESVGWAKERQRPATVHPRGCMSGGHNASRVFAHPHMGICESSLFEKSGLGFDGKRAARGAMRSAARRPGSVRGLASEDFCSSLHHLISGRIVDPYPPSACLRRGSLARMRPIYETAVEAIGWHGHHRSRTGRGEAATRGGVVCFMPSWLPAREQGRW